MSESDHLHDVLVLGSGAAGLSLALALPDRLRVAVLSKGRLDQGATNRAQGGIAAVLGDDDSFESHVRDTLDAGAGLCDEKVVRFVVEHGPDTIRWLTGFGIDLTWQSDPRGGGRHLHLTREGGHSHRRVAHAQDATGRALQACLEQEVARRANINVFEDHLAIDLIARADAAAGGRRCVGAYVLDVGAGRVRTFRARATMLATGGASRAYLHCTNPAAASGDGIAMAWRAGCRVANMEFTQFHPTSLYVLGGEPFLLSEAVRGEGGRLLLPDGNRFMERFDPRGELAPRDIVARAIDHEMKRLGIPYVYLDISHKPASFVIEHFPMLHQRCLEAGHDMSKGPVPVVPAAHYTCGGVMTDLAGRTDLAGLYAAGECAFTGLHGANRLASNSLLECVVFARAAAADIGETLGATAMPPAVPPWDESQVREPDEEVVVVHNWGEIRRFMWDYVGIVRTNKRLERARHRTDMLVSEIDEYYANFRVTPELLELRNLIVVADLIVRSAAARKESRGLHYTLDHPGTDDSAPPRNTVLVPPPRR